MFIVPRTPGRASKDALCTYQSLISFRSGLLFHANRSYCLRKIDPPPRGVLFQQLTEALRFAAKKHNISLYGDINNSHVGLSELSQLIDFDIADTKCIELAEMHHLAWCIGRVCAVRPGSLGYNLKNKDSIQQKKFLRWGDVKIFRGVAGGEFIADLTFRVLKTNSEDPEKGNLDDRPPRPLQCRVLSPKKNENIIFSVPHRLLVIALRRGIINGISTIDELLAGRALNIIVSLSLHVS